MLEMKKRSPRSNNGIKRKAEATRYEILVAQVLKGLYGRNQIKASVEHDVDLPAIARNAAGAAVMRQVDVYAVFDDCNFQPLVVQAKNWKSPIGLPIVDSMNGMLSSLEQKCRGMIVTPSRYQSGAVSVARQQGLELCVLRSTQDIDFAKGKIPVVKGEVSVFVTVSEQVQINVCIGDFEKYTDELKVLASIDPDDLSLFNESDVLVGCMSDLHAYVHSRFPRSENYSFSKKFVINVPLYLQVQGAKIRIYGFSGNFSNREVGRMSYFNKITHLFHSQFSDKVFLIDELHRVLVPGEQLSAVTECIDMRNIFSGPYK